MSSSKEKKQISVKKKNRLPYVQPYIKSEQAFSAIAACGYDADNTGEPSCNGGPIQNS